MPKKAFDYNKTEIYKIIHCDPEKDFCYVGHTTNFTERKKCHTRRCNIESEDGYNFKLYRMIRENGGWDNFKMVFIEKWPCENLREAQAREQHWIDTMKPNMNNWNAYGRKDRTEYVKKYLKMYREKEGNKEKQSAYIKTYREDKKEELAAKRKNYRETNKEVISERRKMTYEVNKETILEKMYRPYTCECGSVCMWQNKLRHTRTQKHIQWCEANP